jgi:thymidine kinase
MEITNTMSIENNTQTRTRTVGYLELILGPMYSGKTSALMKLYKQYTISQMSVVMVNYDEDVRYEGDSQTTMSNHDKNTVKCIRTHSLEEFYKTHNAKKEYEVILINEGQFFDDIEIVTKWCDEDDKIVHVCGLDGDFKRNVFGKLLNLIPHCDSMRKLMSICVGKECERGTRAIYSHRITGEQGQKVIGADNYVPLCRKCYLCMNESENTTATIQVS